jgi:hypothetical protein
MGSAKLEGVMSRVAGFASDGNTDDHGRDDV